MPAPRPQFHRSRRGQPRRTAPRRRISNPQYSRSWRSSSECSATSAAGRRFPIGSCYIVPSRRRAPASRERRRELKRAMSSESAAAISSKTAPERLASALQTRRERMHRFVIDFWRASRYLRSQDAGDLSCLLAIDLATLALAATSAVRPVRRSFETIERSCRASGDKRNHCPGRCYL